MLVLVFESIALLLLGVVVGIFTAMVDVYLVGSASFLTHMLIWVFLNVLIATHVENAGRAMWWSVPINLGFIESYYIATSAGYEGYPRSLMATFALLAVLAPILVYGLWWTKKSRNFYGWLLAACAVGGSLWVSHTINGEISVFAWVIAALSFALLTFIPTRKIKITPAARPEPTEEEREELAAIVEEQQRKSKRRQQVRPQPQPTEPVPEEPGVIIPAIQENVPMVEEMPEEAQRVPRQARPTRRKTERKSERKTERKRRSSGLLGRSRRRDVREGRESEREARRAAAAERRERMPQEPAPDVALPTLGTTRTASRRYESY